MTLQRKPIITEDGSSSIYLPAWNESYHSTHGAVQEAQHVFIDMGLTYFMETHDDKLPVNILEIGFGTGLNAFITLLEAQKSNVEIVYTGIEAYPLNLSEIKNLNYAQQLSAEKGNAIFQNMHHIPWEEFCELTPNFRLKKEKNFFKNISEINKFHLVYFDAFGARVQPELWTEEIFSIVYRAMKKDSVLVTYSAKGSARRAMQSVGFSVVKLAGPPGKRHMLRATKS